MVERSAEFVYEVSIPALVSMENAVAASRRTLLTSRASHRTPAIPGQVKGAAGCRPHTTYHNEAEQTMNSHMRFRISGPQIIHETIDEEVIIINLDNGNYYSLDKVGAEIWGLVESGATVRETAEAITHRYEGSRAVIETAVNQLIAEFQQEDLIVPDKGKEPRSIKGLNTQAETGMETEKPGFEAPILHKYTDMQDLLLLDPIHEVDEAGWPHTNPDFTDWGN